MKDFPSCFSESGVQVSDSSPSTTSKTAAPPQNLVTCIYNYHTLSFSGSITVTWIKNLMAQALCIEVENSAKDSIGKVEIRPWLFSKRKGFKNMVIDSTKVDVYWDLSSAKFGSSPEPLEGFYIAIAVNQELCLLLGDLQSEAYKKIDPSPFASKATFIARKEHIFGKRLYNCKAQFCGKGRLHDVRIEFDPNESVGKCLRMFVDRKGVLEVTQLQWKFRGNQSILIDGVCVEVYWDVHGWLFDGVLGSAIFLFRTQVPGEKKWGARSPSEAPPSSFKDCQRWKDMASQSQGFSLVLCAWKNE